MEKTQPTPGPWGCDTAAQPIIINGPADSDGHHIICTVMDSSCQKGTYDYPAEVAAANARLISAAPLLLGLLRDVSLAMHHGGMRKPKGWLERIDRTLAEAA